MTSEPWVSLDAGEYDVYWAAFEHRFDFRRGMSPSTWPAIEEPSPSITVDLSTIFDGDAPHFAAGAEMVDAIGLYAFVNATPPDEGVIVLDWQHPAYRFWPHRQTHEHRPWPVSIFPNGDYYAFVTEDLRMGTFGHPWEHTLCVWGDMLIERLGRPLAALLGVARQR